MTSNTPKIKTKVIVIGSGLSGLTSAFELQSKGYDVHLYEANPYLGGRTASWMDKSMKVESGLHRVLGFYKEFPRLIKRVGLKMKDVVVWEDEVEIKLPFGKSFVYGASPIYQPIKTFTGIFRNNLVSWADTYQLLLFFISGLKDYFFYPSEKLDAYSVKQYAEKFKVSDEVIERVLVPLTTGIFFLPPEKYSAYVLFGLLAHGVKRFHKIQVGAFKGGMSEVLVDPIANKIRELGGSIYTGSKAERLILGENAENSVNDEIKGVVINGEEIYADFVILATSIGPAKNIIQSSGLGSNFPLLMKIPTMPEINIQVELSKPASPVDRIIFCPGTSFTTFAEQTKTTFKNTPREDIDGKGRVSVILTPPERFIYKSHEEIFEIFIKEAPAINIDPSTIRRYRVVTHPADFYLLSPGTEAMRPETKTVFKNLFLAGDYVKQPLLSTMEGAIISGLNAAKHVVKGRFSI